MAARPAEAEQARQAAPPAPRPAAPSLSQFSMFSSNAAGARHLRAPMVPLNRERYQQFADNPLRVAAEHPVSTFSIDVDTGAYANVRRFLNNGRLPPKDAVRVEEMLNYFRYDYAAPPSREQPFRASVAQMQTPWNAGTRLVRIGIQGFRLTPESLPPANLVFLIDVSGSMNDPAKLGLLKAGLKMLARQLRRVDTVSIAVYAGSSGVVLPPTPGDRTATIEQALGQLRPGGSTNGAAGIKLAYQLARQNFLRRGINRVLLATDGDFNVGTVDFQSLKGMVERERRTGVSLTTLGFGTGNLNEQLMEQLADTGDGNYAYIDSAREAHKVLVQQMAGTLATIAKDVKIQVEFNPATVAEYRLIGYENRSLKREDFNNDNVDAGEIGAGLGVTALYEVTLHGSPAVRVDPLRYSRPETDAMGATSGELAWLRIRYKHPQGNNSRLIEQPVDVTIGRGDNVGSDLRFAAAVAGFGQLLRGGRYTGQFAMDDVVALANSARGDDPRGYRAEFIQLASLAGRLLPGAGRRGERDPQVVHR
ncbi:MAG: VWA domain-containing protein [Pseudomonadota bacterium]